MVLLHSLLQRGNLNVMMDDVSRITGFFHLPEVDEVLVDDHEEPGAEGNSNDGGGTAKGRGDSNS